GRYEFLHDDTHLWIRSLKHLWRCPLEPSTARQSAVRPGESWCKAPQECLGGDGRSDGHGSATRLRGETRVRHARCLQDPRHSVGLVERIDLLASTGRRDGGWIYRAFQMAKDLVDHLTLRDDGDEPQHALLTPGAAGHVQGKDPMQQPYPTPARRRGARLRLIEALLPEGREDRSTEVAVRRQTAAIAHQVDVRQGHE